MARGIGYVVAGQNCEDDPEKDHHEPSSDAGRGFSIVRFFKKAIACLAPRPDLSDVGQPPGRNRGAASCLDARASAGGESGIVQTQ